MKRVLDNKEESEAKKLKSEWKYIILFPVHEEYYLSKNGYCCSKEEWEKLCADNDWLSIEQVQSCEVSDLEKLLFGEDGRAKAPFADKSILSMQMEHHCITVPYIAFE